MFARFKYIVGLVLIAKCEFVLSTQKFEHNTCCCMLLVCCYGAYHTNAINKFAICLENLETQGIYYTIKTSLWDTPYIDSANHTFSV